MKWTRFLRKKMAEEKGGRCISVAASLRTEYVLKCREGVVESPFETPKIPSCMVDEFVWKHLDRWPEHTAVVCGVTGRSYKYEEMRLLAKNFALSLAGKFAPGTMIAIMLPNIPEFPIILLGALEAGLIVSTINPIYTIDELTHQLRDSGSQAVVTMSDNIGKIKATGIALQKDIFVISVLDESVGNASFEGMSKGDVGAKGTLPNERNCQQSALLPYSSGTTGLSKGVLLSHRNLVSNFEQMLNPAVRHILQTSGSEQEVVPGILPFFHIYGVAAVLLRSLSQGCKLVTLPKFDPFRFLSVLKDHKATVLYAVPPVVLFLGNHPTVTKDHLASLRHLVNGAGPISASDAEKVIARSNGNFTFSQAYGLTETSPAVFASPSGKQDYTSLGMTLGGSSVKVLKEDGTLAGVGEGGEICVKGPQVMVGYFKNEKATKESIDSEGYFHTGDVGYYDKEGRFYMIERLKELIKVKGFQVPPAELEAILRRHQGVEDAGVIGVPDDKSGEIPVAFVVKKPGHQVTEKQLKDFVAEKVSPFKRLGGVVFTQAIPKNPSGKILRRILKQQYGPK